MFEFIALNGGTMLVGLVLLGIVTAIVTRLVRDKRRGKCASCDGCSGACHASADCHKNDIHSL